MAPSAQRRTPSVVPVVEFAERDSADGVFEGGGVKGLAFAGALAAAEDAGIRRWVNVAGASAGAITAALLAAECSADQVRRMLDKTEYWKFADYGPGGKFIAGPINALFRLRGLVPGKYFSEWMADRLAESPLGKRLGRELTFGDLQRTDLSEDLDSRQYEKARYKLRVIASDVTAGRMLVLPDDIEGYAETKEGAGYSKDGLPIVRAVRMSMSFPYFFNPVTLWFADAPDRERKAHVIVDGGLLSNFPVWLFDSDPDESAAPGRPRIRRPTLGFRLHPGSGPEQLPYRPVRRFGWPIGLTRAMFLSATEAWDRRMMSQISEVRTVSIPTEDISTLDFELAGDKRQRLFDSGYRETKEFLRSQPAYRNTHRVDAPGPAVTLGRA